MQTEVNYLGQLRHQNLVKLIGYCIDGDNHLLVYEFMPKGSLENHLFRSMCAHYLSFPPSFSLGFPGYSSFKYVDLSLLPYCWISLFTKSILCCQFSCFFLNLFCRSPGWREKFSWTRLTNVGSLCLINFLSKAQDCFIYHKFVIQSLLN